MNQTVTDMVEQINQKPENEQLRLFTALNASQIVYGEDFVQFKVKGDKKVNKVVVRLMQSDTYNIEFWNIRGINCKKVEEKTDIYNDQLAQAVWTGVVLV
jgi:hypothetical protein